MSTIEEFLSFVGDRRVFCCQKIKEDGNLVGIYGTITKYDKDFLILTSNNSIHLININNIIEIEYTPELEIVLA